MSFVDRAIAAFSRQYPALPAESVVVFLLLCASDEVLVPQVAKRLGLAPSTATRLLSLLCEAGLAAQEGDAADKSVRYVLTESGRQFAVTFYGEGD